MLYLYKVNTYFWRCKEAVVGKVLDLVLRAERLAQELQSQSAEFIVPF
jgi:hypothetical protein